jgi:hypothetical protein
VNVVEVHAVKLEQERKGDHGPRRHISNGTMRSNRRAARISVISACREMSSGRDTRRKCSGVTGKRPYKEH